MPSTAHPSTSSAPTHPACGVRRLAWSGAVNKFKGNKRFLPSKPCATCGRSMTWRKAWARNWESVLYCSGACRAGKAGKRPR